MAKYEYLDNAFWETEDRSVLKCIRLTTLEGQEGKKKKDVMEFRKIRPDGSDCPHYKEGVDKVGIAKIDENTAERKERKERENREKRAHHEQKKKTAELEQLFNLKLQAFEIEQIKNSEDRILRGKIRRAQNVVEMNALCAVLIAKELGYYGDKDDAGAN